MKPNRVTVFFSRSDTTQPYTKTYNDAVSANIVEGWLVVDSGNGDIDYFPPHMIDHCESRPKDYDRGS
jgi:hypothetical protein